jgi:hypothetical protein
MSDIDAPIEAALANTYEYYQALAALRELPDRCAANIDELANRIGAKKLTLIGWLRADVKFARLVASKVTGY